MEEINRGHYIPQWNDGNKPPPNLVLSAPDNTHSVKRLNPRKDEVNGVNDDVASIGGGLEQEVLAIADDLGLMCQEEREGLGAGKTEVFYAELESWPEFNKRLRQPDVSPQAASFLRRLFVELYGEEAVDSCYSNVEGGEELTSGDGDDLVVEERTGEEDGEMEDTEPYLRSRVMRPINDRQEDVTIDWLFGDGKENA